MAEEPVVYFAKELKPTRTEKGMLIIADKTFEELNVDEYDSLLITGATDAQEMVEDDSTQEFVSKFYDVGALIGAISIASILLLKIGYLKGKPDCPLNIGQKLANTFFFLASLYFNVFRFFYYT